MQADCPTTEVDDSALYAVNRLIAFVRREEFYVKMLSAFIAMPSIAPSFILAVYSEKD